MRFSKLAFCFVVTFVLTMNFQERIMRIQLEKEGAIESVGDAQVVICDQAEGIRRRPFLTKWKYEIVDSEKNVVTQGQLVKLCSL